MQSHCPDPATNVEDAQKTKSELQAYFLDRYTMPFSMHYSEQFIRNVDKDMYKNIYLSSETKINTSGCNGGL